MRRILLLISGLLFSFTCFSQNLLESRIDSLINAMTVSEKLEQLYNNGFMTTPTNSRLNIPGFIMDDGPHGVRFENATAFPTGIAMASTWDVDYLEQLGKAMGREFHAYGKMQQLGPCIDLTRDPRAGRTAESAGEDTYLAGHVGAAVATGIQTQPVIATLKHFMGESKQAYRHTCNEIVSERNLMDNYGYNFRYAMQESGAMSLMSAYNLINGDKAAESEQSLKQNLRNYWGFPFYVVSDWGAVWDAKKAVSAGTDLCMGSDNYKNDLPGLVASGSVSIEVINEAVRNVLRTKILAGLTDYFPSGNIEEANTPENVKIALDGARKSIILLKNENDILPLSKNGKSIAIIGPNALKGNLNCFGSSETSPPYSVNIRQGIENKIGTTRVTYALGCSINSSNISGYAAAKKIAAESDIVIFAGGLDETQEGEAYDIGNDRKNNSSVLPGKQLELINELAAVNPNIIVVLQSGGVCSVNTSLPNIKGLIYSFYAGQEAGNAIADVIFGDYNPAGHMPVTMPKTDNQLPPWDDNYDNDYGCGYRWFDQRGIVPEYAFGFGLSYTTFSYSNITINPANATAGAPVTVTADIENTGIKSGEEVVQLYVSDNVSTVYMPIKELKGFKRISLAAGEKKTVSFVLNAEDFYYWNETNKSYEIESGTFTIKIGGSSDNLPLSTSLTFTDGQSKPDLKITRVYTMPHFPLQNQKISFYAMVKNLGTLPLFPGQYKINYSVSNESNIASSQYITDTIFPGQVRLIASDSTWSSTTAGVFSLTADFDSENKIDEWLEDNNTNTSDLEVFNASLDPADYNLAFRKTVVVSSVENNSTDLKGDKMVDGNQSSRWSSAFADNQFAVIDLGAEKSFTKINLYWEAAFATEYIILVSTDSVSWETIAHITDGKIGYFSINTNKTGRYIRLDCIKRSTQYGFSLYEFEVINGETSSVNSAPTANAGADITITLPVNSVNISAILSSDPNNDPLTYNWWQMYGSSEAVITESDKSIAFVPNLNEGKYCFAVTVSDNQYTDSDLVYVTVKNSASSIITDPELLLNIFPNPTKDLLNITLPDSSYKRVSIIDLAGQVLMTTPIENEVTSLTINISDLRGGFYFVKISGSNRTEILKIEKR